MNKRKANRLKNYDYSQDGCYFITVCTQGRREWFGSIENGVMELNENGRIVSACWDDLPNHIHGIVVIDNIGNGLKPFPTKNHGLSEIIRALKTFSSRRINETIKSGDKFHWQKTFYDHIIRDESSLNRIREYIVNNPGQWDTDMECNSEVLHGGIY